MVPPVTRPAPTGNYYELESHRTRALAEEDSRQQRAINDNYLQLSEVGSPVHPVIGTGLLMASVRQRCNFKARKAGFTCTSELEMGVSLYAMDTSTEET